VIGLTTSAALEYAPRGIRINAVCPGTIETPMVADMVAQGELDRAEAAANQPIARLGRADEIAAAVLWLCSPGASFVVGVALPVDGGGTTSVTSFWRWSGRIGRLTTTVIVLCLRGLGLADQSQRAPWLTPTDPHWLRRYRQGAVRSPRITRPSVRSGSDHR
jgi:hypothetical protein